MRAQEIRGEPRTELACYLGGVAQKLRVDLRKYSYTDRVGSTEWTPERADRNVRLEATVRSEPLPGTTGSGVEGGNSC